MSRTDDIRQRGGKERGGMVGGTPFVKWDDEYAWIEGRIEGTFQTKYGLAATMKISDVHQGGLSAQGKNEEGEMFTTRVETGSIVNVGLASAALQGKIEEGDIGKAFHIAFEGWQQPANGNRYRVFSVIELTERTKAVPDDEGVGEDGLPF